MGGSLASLSSQNRESWYWDCISKNKVESDSKRHLWPPLTQAQHTDVCTRVHRILIETVECSGVQNWSYGERLDVNYWTKWEGFNRDWQDATETGIRKQGGWSWVGKSLMPHVPGESVSGQLLKNIFTCVSMTNAFIFKLDLLPVCLSIWFFFCLFFVFCFFFLRQGFSV